MTEVSIEKLISSELQIQYRKNQKEKNDKLNRLDNNTLVTRFYNFIKPIEDEIPFMYVDSQGYPTIGCGHLLGFNWSSSFWEESSVKKNLTALNQQIDTNKLKGDEKFKDFPNPENIMDFFSFNNDDFYALFKIKCVAFSLLEALDLPLRVSHATKISSPHVASKIAGLVIGIFAHSSQIVEVFIYLLKLSLLFYVRQKALQRTKNHNPFSGKSFYDVQKNNLVLEEKQLINLTESDIKIKIIELNSQLDNMIKEMKSSNPKVTTTPFSSFEPSAQLGLLDLKFNGARLSSDLLKSAVQRNWRFFLDTSKYGRDVSVYKSRNEEVLKLFREAVKEKESGLVGSLS